MDETYTGDDGISLEELEKTYGPYVDGILNSSINELMERIKRAETVCLILAWARPSTETSMQKALHEVWGDWAGQSYTPTDRRLHPELPDSVIAELAEQYDHRHEFIRL